MNKQMDFFKNVSDDCTCSVCTDKRNANNEIRRLRDELDLINRQVDGLTARLVGVTTQDEPEILCVATQEMNAILADIVEERGRQDEKWGVTMGVDTENQREGGKMNDEERLILEAALGRERAARASAEFYRDQYCAHCNRQTDTLNKIARIVALDPDKAPGGLDMADIVEAVLRATEAKRRDRLDED